MTDDVDALWAAYLQAEKDRIRDVYMPALDRVVDALLRRPAEECAGWVRDVARRIADEGVEIPVRLPLFRRVLAPMLVEDVLAGTPGSARWLSHFAHLFARARETVARLPEAMQCAEGLIEEALRVDPDDARAREKHIGAIEDHLEYTLHELPTGVLYGRDGATVEQCDDLLEQLGAFRREVERVGRMAEFKDLMAEADLHYRAYRDYLQAGCPGNSYATYLESRGLRA